MIEMTKICPECHTENGDDEKFCKNCGINLVDNKTVLYVSENNGKIENWTQKLFYWQDKRTHEYRLAKSKIIAEIVFLIIFIYEMYFYLFIYEVELNIIVAVIAAIIVGLIFSVPVFAVGFLIHYFISK